MIRFGAKIFHQRTIAALAAAAEPTVSAPEVECATSVRLYVVQSAVVLPGSLGVISGVAVT